jgi:hypothetical protein
MIRARPNHHGGDSADKPGTNSSSAYVGEEEAIRQVP